VRRPPHARKDLYVIFTGAGRCSRAITGAEVVCAALVVHGGAQRLDANELWVRCSSAYETAARRDVGGLRLMLSCPRS